MKPVKCSCRIHYGSGKGGNKIVYCAIHESASELLWALTMVLDSIGALSNPSELSGHGITPQESARIFAIIAARKTPERAM